MEEVAELADGPIGGGKMASGGCSFASTFSVTRSSVLTQEERSTRPNMSLK